MKLTLFSVVVLFSSTLALAQVSPPKAYFSTKHGLLVNEATSELNWFLGSFNVGDAFKSNTRAQELYESHRLNAHWGTALIWGGLAGAIGYAIAADDFNSNIYWAIFIPPFLTGALLQDYARKQIIRAVNIYNGVPEKDARAPKLNLIPVVNTVKDKRSHYAVRESQPWGLSLALSF